MAATRCCAVGLCDSTASPCSIAGASPVSDMGPGKLCHGHRVLRVLHPATACSRYGNLMQALGNPVLSMGNLVTLLGGKIPSHGYLAPALDNQLPSLGNFVQPLSNPVQLLGSC